MGAGGNVCVAGGRIEGSVGSGVGVAVVDAGAVADVVASWLVEGGGSGWGMDDEADGVEASLSFIVSCLGA